MITSVVRDSHVKSVYSRLLDLFKNSMSVNIKLLFDKVLVQVSQKLSEVHFFYYILYNISLFFFHYSLIN